MATKDLIVIAGMIVEQNNIVGIGQQSRIASHGRCVFTSKL